MPTKSSSISLAPAPGLNPATRRRIETNLPCRTACPVGTNAGGFVSLIAQGHYREAFLVARKSNPFASICGRICEHPCESACRRQQIDAPISIGALQRFLSEHPGAGSGASHEEILKVVERPRPSVEQGGNVAIVGAGPAGLACAHDLALMGHRTIVFDAARVPGGTMSRDFPEDRLPREMIEGEIDFIRSLGVDIRPGVEIDNAVTVAQLRDEYDAVFLATGQSTDLSFLGEEHELEITPHNTIAVNRATLASSTSRIYAGGDVAFGSGNIIDAVADGRRAARSIDSLLTGRIDKTPSLILKRRDVPGLEQPLTVNDEHPAAEIGTIIESAELARRMSCAGTGTGFTEKQARREGARCLRCWVIAVFDSRTMNMSTCMQCAGCVDVCPDNSIDLARLLRKAPPDEGLFPTLRLPDGQPLSIIASRSAALIKDATTCTRCGLCARVCPTNSITMQGIYRADEEDLQQLCEPDS